MKLRSAIRQNVTKSCIENQDKQATVPNDGMKMNERRTNGMKTYKNKKKLDQHNNLLICEYFQVECKNI